MRPTPLILAMTGIVIGATANAGTLFGPDGAAWTDGDCQAAAALNPNGKCYATLQEAPKSAQGPGGGVLLLKYGNTFFEADPATGAVKALIGDGKRTFTKSVPLLSPLAASRAKRPSSAIAAALEKDGETVVITFSVTTFDASGAVIDEATISFDADTLSPTVGPRALKTFRVATDKSTSTILQYWSATSYWSTPPE